MMEGRLQGWPKNIEILILTVMFLAILGYFGLFWAIWVYFGRF